MIKPILFQIAGVITFAFMAGSCKTSAAAQSPSDFSDKQPSSDAQSKVAAEQVKAVVEHTEGITEKYWKLIEINGKAVVFNETTGGREASLILKNEDNRVNGNGGCNTFFGTYEIDPTSLRIKFSQMASTMKACLNMEVEGELLKALEMVDNYSLSADGKYLSLNRARMAPLARFEVVYLK